MFQSTRKIRYTPLSNSEQGPSQSGSQCKTNATGGDQVSHEYIPLEPIMSSSPSGSDKEAKHPPSPPDDIEVRKSTSSMDVDALRLAELGYTQEMGRNFSVWSVLGVGFSLTNSWFGLVRLIFFVTLLSKDTANMFTFTSCLTWI